MHKRIIIADGNKAVKEKSINRKMRNKKSTSKSSRKVERIKFPFKNNWRYMEKRCPNMTAEDGN